MGAASRRWTPEEKVEEPHDQHLAEVRSFFETPSVYLRCDAHIDLRARAVRELVGDTEPRRIVDVGCGDGRISLQLLRANTQLTLLDVSAAMLARAAERIPASQRSQVQLVNASLAAFETSEPHDLVIAAGIAAHVEDVDGLMRSLSALVAPGGRCIVQITDTDRLSGRLLDALATLRRRVHDVRGYALTEVSAEGLTDIALRHDLWLVGDRPHWRLLPGMARLPGRWTKALLQATYGPGWLDAIAPERLLCFEKPRRTELYSVAKAA